MEGGEWTIPAERMKNRREHRVPLSTQVREILAEATAHVVRNKVEAAYARSGPVRAPTRPDGAVGGVLGQLQSRPVAHSGTRTFAMRTGGRSQARGPAPGTLGASRARTAAGHAARGDVRQ